MWRAWNGKDVLLLILRLRQGLFGTMRLVNPTHMARLVGFSTQGRLDNSSHPFVQKTFICFHRNPLFLTIWILYDIYWIPTPNLDKATSTATANSAIINVFARIGFSTMKIAISKLYNARRLCTDFFIDCNSNELQWISALLQGASTTITPVDIISRMIDTNDTLACSWWSINKQLYSQINENTKHKNFVGICSPFVFSLKNAKPRFKSNTCWKGAIRTPKRIRNRKPAMFIKRRCNE